jgi:hypothetical protein
MGKVPLGENWKQINEVLSAEKQKNERPPIEKVCDYLLDEPTLKEGFAGILAMLEGRGATVSWYLTSTYKVKYKGEAVCQIKIGHGFKFVQNCFAIIDGKKKFDFSPNDTDTSDKLNQTKKYLHAKLDAIDEKDKRLTTPDGKPKSKLEKYISEMAEGDKKANISQLIAWLKDNKMTPQLFSPNSYKASHKNTRLCYIRLPRSHDGDWKVQFVRDGYGRDGYGRGEYETPLDFDKFIESGDLKGFLLSGLKKCRRCYECKPGMPIKVNGSDYQMCIIEFTNPDKTGVDNIIKVIEYWKNEIDL